MLLYPKINKSGYLYITFFFFVVLLLHSCSNPTRNDEAKSVFRFNEANGVSSLDPAFAKDLANLNVCNQLFNGLVQLDSNLNIQPCIAKNWKISENGKTYTFKLRQDVFFHHNKVFKNGEGRRVLAEDFVYSFKRIVDEKTVSPGSWVFNSVKKNLDGYAFTAPNDSTLIIELENPFAPFLSLLSMQYCSVIPFEAVYFYGDEFRKNPIGTGPFYIKYWEEDIKLVLLRNPDYFEKVDNIQLPYLDAINLTFLVDKQSEFLQFIKGNLDYLSGIESSYKDEILNEKGEINSKYEAKINLRKSPYLNTEYIGILSDTNLESVSNSPLKHLKFRQAINLAIDKEKMLRYLRNNVGSPGNRGFLPASFLFANAEYGYKFNKQKALNLLDELKKEQKLDKFPPITIVAASKSIDLVKFIQHQLAEVGIEMEVELMQWATLKEVVANAKAVFFRGSWIADYPDAENYLSLFYTPNFAPKGPNYTHFSNSDFDSLYISAIRTTDIDLKHKFYREMDSLLMQEAVIIPLYYDEVLRFTQKNINNLPTSPMNLLNLKFVKKDD